MAIAAIAALGSRRRCLGLVWGLALHYCLLSDLQFAGAAAFLGNGFAANSTKRLLVQLCPLAWR